MGNNCFCFTTLTHPNNISENNGNQFKEADISNNEDRIIAQMENDTDKIKSITLKPAIEIQDTINQQQMLCQNNGENLLDPVNPECINVYTRDHQKTDSLNEKKNTSQENLLLEKKHSPIYLQKKSSPNSIFIEKNQEDIHSFPEKHFYNLSIFCH